MNEQDVKILKKQTFWMRLTALFMGGIFLVAVLSAMILVPKAASVMTDAEETLQEVNVGVVQLNKTATQLARIDFAGLVDDTQQMVNDGSEGITQAIGKIEAMDIDGLNRAIQDLEAIVEPLAKLFGKR
ncbi:MAG: hypothetical protein MJ117_04210 [Lachnospiraceae bacterium]|nr:hypothetical protein [Lachnospiraceae bacterium]